MEQVICLIKERLRMDELGGRVEVYDMTSCMVYDTAYFPDDLIDTLKHSHGAWVEVMSNTCSLSGFVVRVTLRSRKTTRVVVTGTLIACMCAIVAQSIRRDI